MPLPNKPWTTDYPTSQDNLGVNQPDQIDDSYPGAQDGNRLLVSHLHALRDKLDAVANKVGDNSNLPGGCHGARISALEGAGAGQTDTVAGANGITNTGNNVDAVLEPTYGSSANTVCQGNDSRLSDARTPTAHASSHQSGGADAIKLDDLSAPDDNTDLNATTGAHGLLPKLSGDSGQALLGDGTWGAVAAGGFSGREQEYTAAGGDENFTLAATPATNANMLSGVNIIGVFRNGQRLRYRAAPATGLEYGYTAPTAINCKALSLGDIITVVYSE